MPIREKGYYTWEGKLKESHIRWLPIFFNGIAQVFRKKRAKLLFASASSTFFVFLIAIYVMTKPELKIFTQLVSQIKINDALLFKTFYTNGFLVFMMIILSLFCGADLISADLRHKSFTLYLSRPISKPDYLKGKFSIVLFYLLLFTLVPGLLLILAKVLFTATFSVSLSVFLAALIFPVIVSLFLASLILMMSSFSSNLKFVSIMFIAFYLITNMIAGIFKANLGNDYFLLFSIEKNISQFGAFIFNTNQAFNAPAWISCLVIVLLTLTFITVLAIRIRKVEA